jgi:ATPase family associated with various cellular activities (AAA)
VQALCRIALAEPNDALRRQVERLRLALAESGESKESAALAQLLTTTSRSSPMAPSRLVRSRATYGVGEKLTPQVAMPVDRETAVSLATVMFPNEISGDPPVLGELLQQTAGELVEEWTQRDALERVDVEIARSCLIYGAPGTGKTRLALWMCRQLQLPAITAKLDGLVSSFLGTTSRNIGALFAFAARYQCVLLLDEFDAIAKVRDDPQEVGEIKRVVNTLLQNLDLRRNVGFTIGITNHELLLDSAVWRRFDAQLLVPRPDFQARLAIVRRYINPMLLQEAEIRFIAWITDGATGADIETLVNSVKKAIALGAPDYELIPLLQRTLIQHSRRFGSDRTASLGLDSAALSKQLLRVTDLGYSQSDLATLFKRNKATVSRWINEEVTQGVRATH